MPTAVAMRPSALPAGTVWLNIYDLCDEGLGSWQKTNGMLRGFGTGAFHVGVEVYGQEWTFGYDFGVCRAVRPRYDEDHQYRESYCLGTTRLSPQQVQGVIARLRSVWRAQDYDMLRQNCCHFAEALSAELGAQQVPGWVTSLAGFAAVLDDARGVFSFISPLAAA